MMLAATVTCAQAAGQTWDAVVVGGGPSGALAARELARRDASVLLVDRAVFPRYKVCGCCLNASALGTLAAVGLGELPAACGGRPIHELCLAAGGRLASIPLRQGIALSRERFDAALITQAIQAGAAFLPRTHAALQPDHGVRRRILLRQDSQQVTIMARVVLAADGLAGTVLQDEPGVAARVARHSRIGVGAVADTIPRGYRSGTIVMACGRGGYVGLVQREDGRLNVAAALDPSLVRDTGGPGAAVASLIAQAGLPDAKDFAALEWRGTPALTRRRSSLAAHRVFALGDAAGYVEPFTGEGIAWALASGAAVTPLTLTAIRYWSPSLAIQWTRRYRQLIGHRQRLCWLLAQLLRQPHVTQAAIGVLSRMPWCAVPLVRVVNAPLSGAWRES